MAEPYLIRLEVDGKPEGKKLKTVEVERLLMDYLGGCRLGSRAANLFYIVGRSTIRVDAG